MKITDRFSTEREEWCWALHETVPAQDKYGNPRERIETTYHANLDQVFAWVLDKELGDVTELREIASVVEKAKWDMAVALRRLKEGQVI